MPCSITSKWAANPDSTGTAVRLHAGLDTEGRGQIQPPRVRFLYFRRAPFRLSFPRLSSPSASSPPSSLFSKRQGFSPLIRESFTPHRSSQASVRVSVHIFRQSAPVNRCLRALSQDHPGPYGVHFTAYLDRPPRFFFSRPGPGASVALSVASTDDR
ncbi:hypothetical protein VTG60DRAFT_3792 [Thermothelomyces hinnuleus]